MIDLQECRNEIDKIDSDIIRLFEQRMKVCEDVAEYKIRTGKKVLDPVCKVRSFLNHTSVILICKHSHNIRALPAGELAKTVSEYNPNVQAMDTIKDAVEEAFSLAGEQDVIIAFVSLSGSRTFFHVRILYSATS